MEEDDTVVISDAVVNSRVTGVDNTDIRLQTPRLNQLDGYGSTELVATGCEVYAECNAAVGNAQTCGVYSTQAGAGRVALYAFTVASISFMLL